MTTTRNRLVVFDISTAVSDRHRRIGASKLPSYRRGHAEMQYLFLLSLLIFVRRTPRFVLTPSLAIADIPIALIR